MCLEPHKLCEIGLKHPKDAPPAKIRGPAEVITNYR